MYGSNDHAPRWGPLVLLALLVAMPPAIVGLLLWGDRAAPVVSMLSLLFAFVFGMAPLMARQQVSASWRDRSAAGKWGYGLGVFGLSAALFALVYSLVHVPAVDVVVANSIRVDRSDELTPSTPVTIHFLGPTPDRENLGLRLHLDDYIGSGDCTTSATLTLTPLLGGQQAPAVQVPEPGTSARPADEVTVPIRGTVQDLRIEVTLNSEIGCRLRLVVNEAVFYG